MFRSFTFCFSQIIWFICSYNIRMKKMMEEEDDVELDTSTYSMADQSLANESMRSIDA